MSSRACSRSSLGKGEGGEGEVILSHGRWDVDVGGVVGSLLGVIGRRALGRSRHDLRRGGAPVDNASPVLVFLGGDCAGGGWSRRAGQCTAGRFPGGVVVLKWYPPSAAQRVG